MIVDSHAHVWHHAPDKGKERILKISKTYDVRKFFLSTLNEVIYSPSEEVIRQCNEITYGFMKEQPDLIRGMAYLNPVNPNCVDELKRCVEDYGMSGVKLWVAVFCDDERINPIAEAAIGYGIPVLAHCFKKAVGQLEFESTGPNVENLGRRYPELKIIMAHLGANVYDTIKCVKEYDNIYTDFSGSVCRRDDLDYTIRHLGVERVLFGSDIPIAFEDCIGQVECADITEDERKMIYYGNACKLFGLGDIGK